MRWKLFATLAETTGETAVEVTHEGDDPTLREALDALVATYPELEAEIFDEDGSLHPHIRLLCDGTDPFHEGEGWEESVAEVEEFALFPPVSGG
jgi:molybdopterin synthase sulfur carrier subunit